MRSDFTLNKFYIIKQVTLNNIDTKWSSDTPISQQHDKRSMRVQEQCLIRSVVLDAHDFG